jgi:glycosyltransferase involved in cell wall biosynthesis
MTISVCLASFNGEKFIRLQVETILNQLGATDELIIVDDCSSDGTMKIIESIADRRVRKYRNERNRGHVATFSRAIGYASGKIIFLSDQDDIWPRHRLSAMVTALSLRGDGVVVGLYEEFHDGSVGFGMPTPPNGRDSSASFRDRSAFRNIVGMFLGRRRYFGSVMGFTEDVRRVVFPIPNWVEAHDLWIAACGFCFGNLEHLNEIVTLRRLHESNLTPARRRSLWRVAKSRLIMAVMFCFARMRNNSNHGNMFRFPL